MSKKTSLNLQMTSAAGKKISKSVTDVDPNAQQKDLLDFTEQFVDLTTNTLDSTTRIDKEELVQGTNLTFEVTSNSDCTRIDDTHYTVTDAKLAEGASLTIQIKNGTNNVTADFVQYMTAIIYRTSNSVSNTAFISLTAEPISTGQTTVDHTSIILIKHDFFTEPYEGKIIWQLPSGTYNGAFYNGFAIEFNIVP